MLPLTLPARLPALLPGLIQLDIGRPGLAGRLLPLLTVRDRLIALSLSVGDTTCPPHCEAVTIVPGEARGGGSGLSDRKSG